MKLRARDPLTGLPLQALRFMADGDGGAGGGGTGDGQGGNGGQGGGSGSGDGGNGTGDQGKTFTQADVERMIADRLARERGQNTELRAKAAKWDEHEANSASELEKATKKAADDAAAAARAEVTVERVLDKIEVAAAGKFADPEDAQLRLGKRAQEFIDKDGKIDTKAIAAAVDQLLKDKPHLAAKTTTDPADASRAGLGGQGGNGSGGTAATIQPGLGRLQHAYEQSSKTGTGK